MSSVPNGCAQLGARQADLRVGRQRIVGREHVGEDRGEHEQRDEGAEAAPSGFRLMTPHSAWRRLSGRRLVSSGMLPSP